MHKRAPRAALVAPATLLSLVLASHSAPTSPSLSASPPPDPEQIALLEELVGWLTGTPIHDSQFHLLGGDDLLLAIRERSRSFELFRRYPGTEANRRFLDRMPYGDAIYRAARRYQLDSLLLAAVVEAESGFNPRAVSADGAVGLTQVLPAMKPSLSLEELQDPETNLDTGARYLRQLLDLYEGDLGLALAAYNAGPGSVARYRGVPPYRETRTFLSRVLGLYVGHRQEVWEASGAEEELLALR
jgi:soluble lytic murein transglycosylase-like protein